MRNALQIDHMVQRFRNRWCFNRHQFEELDKIQAELAVEAALALPDLSALEGAVIEAARKRSALAKYEQRQGTFISAESLNLIAAVDALEAARRPKERYVAEGRYVRRDGQDWTKVDANDEGYTEDCENAKRIADLLNAAERNREAGR